LNPHTSANCDDLQFQKSFTNDRLETDASVVSVVLLVRLPLVSLRCE